MALSNLQTRILSAAILIPVAVFILWYGSWLAAIALAIVAGIAAWEWGNIIQKTPAYTLPKIILILSSIIIPLLWGSSFLISSYDKLFITAILTILILNLLFFAFYKNTHKNYYITGFLAIGLTSISLLYLLLFPDEKQGWMLLAYLFIITWAMDSGAYFCGRFFKGPKLAPKISPNKTWSGFIGGLFCVIILSLLIYFGGDFGGKSFVEFLLLSGFGVVIAALGHGGDLAESAFKRKFNVKDSSQIIPGHGGVLDRLDSLAVSAWLLALFFLVSALMYDPSIYDVNH